MTDQSVIVRIVEKDMPRGKTLTEEQAAKRREEIMDAAAKCFAKKGYHLTTISDIVRKAGLAHGTFYLYFASKKDLLLRFVEQAVRESAVALFRSADPQSPAKVLGDFIESRLRIHGRNADLVRVIFSEALFDDEMAQEFTRRGLLPTAEALADYLKRCNAAGSLKVKDATLAAQTLMAIVSGHVLLWGHIAGDTAPKIPVEARVRFMRDFFVNRCLQTRGSAESRSKG